MLHQLRVELHEQTDLPLCALFTALLKLFAGVVERAENRLRARLLLRSVWQKRPLDLLVVLSAFLFENCPDRLRAVIIYLEQV